MEMPAKYISNNICDELHKIALSDTLRKKEIIKETDVLNEVLKEGLKVVNEKRKKEKKG